MHPRPFLCVLLLAAGLVHAPSSPGAGLAKKVTYCSLDYTPPHICALSDQVTPDGTHQMKFTSPRGYVHFSGRQQTHWWSGQLNGRRAMGYELNRGHMVLSTLDQKTTFEWWSEGNEHGSY